MKFGGRKLNTASAAKGRLNARKKNSAENMIRYFDRMASLKVWTKMARIAEVLISLPLPAA